MKKKRREKFGAERYCTVKVGQGHENCQKESEGEGEGEEHQVPVPPL